METIARIAFNMRIHKHKIRRRDLGTDSSTALCLQTDSIASSLWPSAPHSFVYRKRQLKYEVKLGKTIENYKDKYFYCFFLLKVCWKSFKHLNNMVGF